MLLKKAHIFELDCVQYEFCSHYLLAKTLGKLLKLSCLSIIFVKY